MRAEVSRYELVTPATLDEALALLSSDLGYRPFAGGTDLMVVYAAGTLKQARFVNLWGLGALRGIETTDAAVTIGALTTYQEIQASAVLCAEFPMLCQAASETGGWAIQNRGTLGGNIANASPAADSSPALLAYGAELELLSSDGARWVPYDTYHTGYKQTLLLPGEIIARVRLPRWREGRVHTYRKVGPRRAQAISKICFAGCADLQGDKLISLRVALGGVAPTVVRARGAEAALLGGGDDAQLRAALSGDIAPIDDVRSTARYRRRVAENLLGDFASQVRGARRR